MKIQYEAAFLEEFIGHIKTRYEHYLMDGNSVEALASDFVDWVINQDHADIYHKRGRDKLSYEDVRDDKELYAD